MRTGPNLPWATASVKQIGRRARRQDDDDGAGDDLVHAIADRQGGVQQAHQRADRQRDRHAEEQARQQRPVIGRHFGHERGESARQHHAFDADVDDAGALAQDAAQRFSTSGTEAQREVKRTDAKERSQVYLPAPSC